MGSAGRPHNQHPSRPRRGTRRRAARRAAGTSLLLLDPGAGEEALLPVLERAVGTTFSLVPLPGPTAMSAAAVALARKVPRRRPGRAAAAAPQPPRVRRQKWF